MATKSEIIEKLKIAIEENMPPFDAYGSPEFKAKARWIVAEDIAERCLSALSEYITFVEEREEPQVGDLVKYKGDPDYDSEDLCFGIYEGFENGELHLSTSTFNSLEGFYKVFARVVERDGKPVITLDKQQGE